MNKYYRCLPSVCAAMVLGATTARAAEPPALDIYGDLPGIERAAISPSGKGLAIVGRNQGERQLVVLDAEHRVRGSVPAGEAKIRSLNWAGENIVILELSKTETTGAIFLADKYEALGALVVPLNNTKPWMVFDKTQGMANVIYGDFGTRYLDGKWQGFFSGVEMVRNASGGYTLFGSTQVLAAVDLESSSTKRVARLSANGYRRTWLIDDKGAAAVTFDLARRTGAWSILNAQGDKLASGVNQTGDVNVVAFGRDGSTVIYWLEDDKTGQASYFEVPLTSGEARPVFSGLSIERWYIDQTNGRLLGYRENGEPPRMTFFDPAKQVVARKILRAFPNLHVDLEDWTPDFKELLVHTSGTGDSGTWYIVDMTRMKADEVGSERPKIPAAMVGPVSTFAYKAADGMALDGVLTLPPGREAKNLPVIMFPHGGPASHDEAEFDWWAQAFAARGYAVFQPNFRGSDNRDQAFVRAGYGQWGRKMQIDISDGLAELARQGIVDPKRACIMGGSYGGYAALAGVTLQHGLYRCAVSVAGVSDLMDLYNKRNYRSGDNAMTWRSMQESFGKPETFAEVSPRRHAASADAPIMLIHGKDDTVVDFSQSTAMVSALQNAGKPNEFVVLQHEDHWLSRAETRKQMLEAAVRFVQQYNPAN